MALVHERIYNLDNFTHPNLLQYLNRLCRITIDSLVIGKFSVNLSMSEEKKLISIDQIVPIGLIISELLMNSLKHGTSGIKEIDIHIGLKTVDTILYINYSDNGISDQKRF